MNTEEVQEVMQLMEKTFENLSLEINNFVNNSINIMNELKTLSDKNISQQIKSTTQLTDSEPNLYSIPSITGFSTESVTTTLLHNDSITASEMNPQSDMFKLSHNNMSDSDDVSIF